MGAPQCGRQQSGMARDSWAMSLLLQKCYSSWYKIKLIYSASSEAWPGLHAHEGLQLRGSGGSSAEHSAALWLAQAARKAVRRHTGQAHTTIVLHGGLSDASAPPASAAGAPCPAGAAPVDDALPSASSGGCQGHRALHAALRGAEGF